MLVKRGNLWHTRLMFKGTLYQKSLHTASKDEARNLESLFRTALIRGEFGLVDGNASPTLEEFKARFLQHLKVNVAPRTYGFYGENLRALLMFEPLAKARLSKIQPALIEKFIQFRLTTRVRKAGDSKGVTPVTVNHSLRTLRRALILARDWKIIPEVPKIRLLPGENQREYVIDEELLTIMVEYLEGAYPTSTMRWMLPFLVDTGLRISEACGLRREHVNLAGKPGSIQIVKGKSKYAKREIPLTLRAARSLREAMKRSRCGFVWTSKGGRKPLTRHYPSEQFRMIRMVCNLPEECVLHSTRHTFCTRLGLAGADAFTIQRLAGHSSITISQRYVHSHRAIKEAAIDLLNKWQEPQLQQPLSGVVTEI